MFEKAYKLYLIFAAACLTVIVFGILGANKAFAEQPVIYVFDGRAVSNSITDVKSNAWGVEQETPTQYGLWDFGYLNEGHQQGDKRDGIYALMEFDYPFSHNVTTSFGIGPYFTSTTQTEPNGVDYRDHYSWAGLAAASVKYRATSHWSLKARWAHVVYAAHNKDADVFLVGVGYSPPSW